MAFKWNISHADRMVTVTVEGVNTLKDVEAYLDAIVVAGAMPYKKLVDFRGKCRRPTTT